MTNDLAEQFARAMCIAEGRDPDRISLFIKVPLTDDDRLRHEPLWKNYETAAQACDAIARERERVMVEALREVFSVTELYLDIYGSECLGRLDAARASLPSVVLEGEGRVE